MTTAKKSNDDGEVPANILHQLEEHTVGGYALFSFNAKTGIPQHMLMFDTPAHALAMQKYIGDWIEALELLQIECAAENIRTQLEANKEEDDEEEDRE